MISGQSFHLAKPMEGLRKQKQALKEELKRITQEMRRKRKRQPSAGGVGVTESQRKTARALMVMRAGEPTAAMAFLRSKRKRAATDSTHAAEMESHLREWWLSADGETKARHSAISPANENMHNAIKAARRFVVDEDLDAWVAEQNISKGINPVPALTLQEASSVKDRIGVASPATRRGARQWMQRWRRRRQLRLRKFPVLERMEDSDLRGKADIRRAAQK